MSALRGEWGLAGLRDSRDLRDRRDKAVAMNDDEWAALDAAAAAGGAEAFPDLSPEVEAELDRLAKMAIAQRRIRSDEARYQALLQRAARQFREAYEGQNALHQVTCPGCLQQFARRLDEAGTVYCPCCGHRFEWQPGRLIPRDPKWQSPM